MVDFVQTGYDVLYARLARRGVQHITTSEKPNSSFHNHQPQKREANLGYPLGLMDSCSDVLSTACQRERMQGTANPIRIKIVTTGSLSFQNQEALAVYRRNS